jgi:branched-chain amino acid transport system substrate-binding protein
VRSPLVQRLCGIAAVAALAACSNDGTAATTTSAVQSAPTTTERVDDGTLVVGAVLPNSGIGAELGGSMRTALAAALAEINANGGIDGTPVRLITLEEGEDAATAGLAVQQLVQRNVDAIIGPTSSLVTLGTLAATVDAGVLTCSPTATALSLDDFPDDGLLLRTIPSDSLQARAIAEEVEASGRSSALVVYIDDAYGRPFAQATQQAIIANGGQVLQSVGFLPTEDSIADAVDAIIAADPGVVAVIADGTSGPAIINALDAADPTGRLAYVVNDAQRRPSASAQTFDRSLNARIVGVSPLPFAGNAAFQAELEAVDPAATGLFAHNAYDCLVLIALAAQSSGTTQPRTLSAAVSALSTNGTSCSTFTACSAALVEGSNINYDGPTGTMAIDLSGNMSRAEFERFEFDDNGRDIAAGSVVVGSG